MNSLCMKNIFRHSAIKQIFQCNLNNGNHNNINTNISNQRLSRNYTMLSKLPLCIFSKIDMGLTSNNFHTLSILYNEKDIKPNNSDQKLGLADELLATTVKSDTLPPLDDEETRKQKQVEKERSMRALKFTYITFGGMLIISAGLTVWAWGVPKRDEKGNPIEDEFSSMPILKEYVYRTWRELKSMNRMIQEPSSYKLLPDALAAPYFQPPYTLVLELTDILVHPEWTYQSGWRFKKRPGVDFLLQHCAPPHFEVVIYTSEQGLTAHPVVEQLDPHNIIWYRIYKDGTRYENGKHFKDLYCLNRDLNKVIAIDWNKEASTSPRNTLNIKRWEGDMEDNTLVDLAVMLRTITESGVGDVREVLSYYNTFDDPIGKFKENHRLALEREDELQKESQPQHKSILSNFVNLKLKSKTAN